MSDALGPKLQALVRLLSSDRDGEMVATARALARTLQSHKLDFHWLADNIGRGGALDRREPLDDEPTWHEIARECQRHPSCLRGDREKEFVSDMVRRTVRGGKLSEKQENWLRAIYARVR
jgi:hypothetical protein